MIASNEKTEAAPDTDPFAETRAIIATIQARNRQYGLPAGAVSGRTAPDWLESAVGLFEGSAEFERAVRYGVAWRNADRPNASTK